MRHVLFLDIDGVLNRHEWCHLGSPSPRIGQPQADVLRAVIAKSQHPVCAVISSAWGKHIESGDVTPAGFSWMLRTHGIEIEVIGGFDGSRDPARRTEQIHKYRADHALQSWIAIDDMGLSIPKNRHVQPHPSFGLEPRHASEILEKLKGQP